MPSARRTYFTGIRPSAQSAEKIAGAARRPWAAGIVEEVGLTPHLAHAPRAREMAKGYSKSDRPEGPNIRRAGPSGKDAIFLGKLRIAGEIFPESYLAPPEVYAETPPPRPGSEKAKERKAARRRPSRQRKRRADRRPGRSARSVSIPVCVRAAFHG